MARSKAWLVFAVLALCAAAMAGQKRDLPPGPAFDSSVVALPDVGQVKPIDKKSDLPIKIAVIGMENNPFWIPVKEGALDAKAELAPLNCTVDWIVPAGDAHTSDFFGNTIEACIAQRYDAIATVAGDSGLVPYINRAVDAGIPVATFNVETTEPNKRLFFVGADLNLQGREAGKVMAGLIGGKGKVAVQTGFFSVEGHEQRRLGFEEALAEFAPGSEIVGRMETRDQADIAYGQAQDFMLAHPDLAGIFSAAGGSFGMARAVEERGKAGQIKIVCYDFMDEVMEYVAKGVITGTIGQGPYAQGHDPAIRLYNYIVGGVVPPAARLFNDMPFVTRDDYLDWWTPPADWTPPAK
ncbi:MAG: sugar ABC transporter substrate-binding protein [Planctomycetota bacterium]|jgi:ABC-type sugar transport system substrate-binding protein|nr:sugar ABC transporter substrate-binding protein [Planctomycetota bacterium]